MPKYDKIWHFETYEYTSTVEVFGNESSTLKTLVLLQNYPNPFNPSTTIRYGLEKDSYVKVEIYNILGKLITTLQNEIQTQGWHSVIWNGTNQHGKQAHAGLYLSKTTSNNKVKTTKLMLLK